MPSNTDPAAVANLIRKRIEASGLTPTEWARAIDALTPEQIRAAQERPESRPGLPPAEGSCAEGLTNEGDTACECPTRPFIARVVAEYAMWPDMYADDPEKPSPEWTRVVRVTFGHRLVAVRDLRAALLAPCPCEGMRQRLADYDEMARLRWHQMGRPEDLYPGGPLAAYDTLFYAARDELANLQGERAVLLVEMQPADGTLIGVAAEMGRLRAQLAHYQRVANGAMQVVGDLESKQEKLLEYARAAKGSRDVHSVYEVLDALIGECGSLRAELATAVSSHTQLSNFADPMSDVDRLCIEIESARAQKESAQEKLAASQERERALRAYHDAAEKYILRLRQIVYAGHPDVRDEARWQIDSLDLAGAVERAASALATPEGNK